MKNRGISWAAAALAVFCVAAPVAASVWTNINWMLVWHLKATTYPYPLNTTVPSDTNYIRKIGNRFDYMIADKVEHKWKKYLTAYGGTCANAKVVFYDNVTNVSMSSNRMKYLYFMHIADSAGYSHEKFFLHSRKDWLSSYALTQWGGTTTADTRLGSPYDLDDGIAILQTGSMDDYNPSYKLWRRVISDQNDSSAANAYTILNAISDTLAMGYFEKFDALYFRVVTPPAAGHTVKYLYLRSDSTLQPLSTIDSTLTSTPKGTGTIHRFDQSGWLYFTPPSDWGYKAAWRPARSGATMDNFAKPAPLRGYWIFAICTNTASSNVKLNYILKRPIFNRAYTTCLVPGWNDSLDSNGDEYLDTTEVARIDSCKAAGDTCTARFKYYSRIPDFGAWNTSHPARCFINLADTTVRRTNALFIAANVDSFDGVYEDNCVPSDGSVSLSAGSPALNLADSAFIGAGNSTGSNFPIVNARTAVVGRKCLIKEYRDASAGNYGTIGVGDSTRWRPGRMFQIDHLEQDSLIYLYVCQRRGKLYVGNGSQFYTDWMRDGAQTPNGGAGDNSHTIITITSQAGPIFRGANAVALTDSAPYFAWRYHNGWEHESWNSTKNQTWQSTGFPVYNVPDQWRAGGGNNSVPGFYSAPGRVGFFPYSSSVDNGTNPNWNDYNHSSVVTRDRDMVTALASYLCFAKKDSSTGSKTYMGWRSGSDRTGAYPEDTDSSAWFPALVKMADLGIPVADTAVVYKKACMTGCAGSQDSITVFVRQYTGGIVFLRPKANGSSVYDSAAAAAAVTIQDTIRTDFRVPASTAMQKLRWDGTLAPYASTMDTLKNAVGRVYIYYATGDATPPTVSIASPAGGASFCTNPTGDGGTMYITFTPTDAGGISHAEFTYSVDGGTTWLNTQEQEDQAIVASSGSPTTHGVFLNSSNMPGIPSSTVRFRIRAFDLAGNIGADSSASNINVRYCASSRPRWRKRSTIIMR